MMLYIAISLHILVPSGRLKCLSVSLAHSMVSIGTIVAFDLNNTDNSNNRRAESQHTMSINLQQSQHLI